MTQKYKIYLNKKLIDAVFYADSDKITKDEIRKSLIEHDGYDASIKIVKCRASKPAKQIQSEVTESLIIQYALKANKQNGIRIDLAIRIACEKYDLQEKDFDSLASKINQLIKENSFRI